MFLQNKFILSSLFIHLWNAMCKLNAGKECWWKYGGLSKSSVYSGHGFMVT